MKHVIQAAVVVGAPCVAPMAAHAQFGGLLGAKGGDAKSGAVSPDEIEKNLRQIISGANRTNRNLGEALGLKEQVSASEQKAECAEKGSCGLSDAATTAVTTADTLKKYVAEQQANGVKLNSEAGDKLGRAIEGGLKQGVYVKKLTDDAKNIDKTGMAAVKAATVIKNIPDGVNAVKGSFGSFEALIKYMSYSGIPTDTLQASLKDAVASIGQ